MPNEECTLAEILEVQHFDEKELIERLRYVTMLEDEKTKPYEKAYIQKRHLPSSEL